MRTYHFLTYRTGMYGSKFSPTGNLAGTDFVQINLDSNYRCRIVPNRPFILSRLLCRRMICTACMPFTTLKGVSKN